MTTSSRFSKIIIEPSIYLNRKEIHCLLSVYRGLDMRNIRYEPEFDFWYETDWNPRDRENWNIEKKYDELRDIIDEDNHYIRHIIRVAIVTIFSTYFTDKITSINLDETLNRMARCIRGNDFIDHLIGLCVENFYGENNYWRKEDDFIIRLYNE